MLKRIFTNTLAQVASRVFFVLLSLVTTSALTRRLGPEGWGSWVFLTSFVLLLVAISDWGTQIIGVREVSRAKKKEKKEVIYASLFSLRLILALGCFLIGLGVILFTPLFKFLVLPAFISLVLVFLLSFDTSFEVVFQSFLKMGWKAFLDGVYAIAFLVFVLLSLFSGWGLVGVVCSWFLARGLVVFIGWRLSNKLLKLGGSPSKTVVRRLWRESLPTGALMIIFTAYDRGVDAIFLKHFWSETEVGFYGLAYKVYGNLVMLAYFLANSLFPVLSKRGKEFGRVFSWGIGLVLVGGVSLAVLVSLTAPWLISVLGGEEFRASVNILRILAFSLIFAYLNHILGFSLIALGRQKMSLVIGALALSWNLVLNWRFIPEFAAQAAAWITVSTEGLVFIFSALALFYWRKKAPFSLK